MSEPTTLPPRARRRWERKQRRDTRKYVRAESRRNRTRRSKWYLTMLLPLGLFPLLAPSCRADTATRVTRISGEHIDYAYIGVGENFCMMFGNPDDSCWPRNTVWWYEENYQLMLTPGPNWVKIAEGWHSRECLVARAPSACYNVNGWQLNATPNG